MCLKIGLWVRSSGILDDETMPNGRVGVKCEDVGTVGQARLENLLRFCGGSTAEQIIKGILDRLSAFADARPQPDDKALVVMKVQHGYDV